MLFNETTDMTKILRNATVPYVLGGEKPPSLVLKFSGNDFVLKKRTTSGKFEPRVDTTPRRHLLLFIWLYVIFGIATRSVVVAAFGLPHRARARARVFSAVASWSLISDRRSIFKRD